MIFLIIISTYSNYFCGAATGVHTKIYVVLLAKYHHIFALISFINNLANTRQVYLRLTTEVFANEEWYSAV